MNEVLAKVQSLLSSNGGRMLYPALLAEMDYQERQHLRRALQTGKQNGILKPNMVWDAEAKESLHWIELIPAQVQPESEA